MSTDGVISYGIGLTYTVTDADGGVQQKRIDNVMEIPELGGVTESIEITTLSDPAHRYTKGIKNYGDAIDFKVLYDMTTFEDLLYATSDEPVEWQVCLPDENGSCKFSGYCTVKLDGVGVNSALTYTLSILPTTQMTWEF